MARFYRKRGYKRRRIGYRPRFRRRRLFRRRFRRQLTRIGIARPERKFRDLDIPNAQVAVFATSLTPVLLTGIPEGSDNNERIGRRVLLTNLQIRLNFIGAYTTDDPSADPWIMCRMLIVRDSQFTGANVPTLGDVLGTTEINSIYAYNDLQVQGTSRFRTMVDKMWLQYTGQVGATPGTFNSDIGMSPARFWKYFKKMRKELFFNGPTDVNSDAGRNAIWIFVFHSSGNVARTLNIEGGVRIRFTDV